MQLLPYTKMTLRSALAPDEFARRLRSAVGEARLRTWPWESHGRAFEGVVEGRAFRITRVTHLKSSLLPVIRGRIDADIGGSSIALVIRLHAGQMLIAAVFLSFALSRSLSTLRATTLGVREILWALVPLICFAPFAFLCFTVPFVWEVGRARRALEQLDELEA